MSEQSPRMDWSYPSREDDPWWNAFNDFVTAVDGSGFAHREDRSIIWSGGGTVSWDLGTETLQWTDTISIYSPMSAKLMRIQAGSIVGWADGEIVYLNLTRLVLTNVVKTLSKASALPSNDDAMAFGVRIGDVVYFRTGMSLGDGDSASGIAPVPGGVGGGGQHTAKIIVGNSVAGDTLSECHYLDPGDGSGVVAALAAAFLSSSDVWIRPGIYDLGAGVTPVGMITIPDGVTVRGAGRESTIFHTSDGSVSLDPMAFALGNGSTLLDVAVFCPVPTDYMNPTTDYIVECTGVGALVQRVLVSFDNYWNAIADPYYADYISAVFGASGPASGRQNRLVDCEALSIPWDNMYIRGVYHFSSVFVVERFHAEGSDTGAYIRGADCSIVNSFFENDFYMYYYGIEASFGARAQIIGNRVAGRFDGGNGSKPYRVIGSNNVVMANNVATASAATANARFIDISQSDRGSFTGNVGVGFVDGIYLNATADDNIVIGNNVGGATIIDLGTGNDLAHNK